MRKDLILDGTEFSVPPFGVTDLYAAAVVTLPLLVLHGLLWVPFTILTLPALAACWFYQKRQPRPLRSIENGPGSAFARLRLFTSVTAFPAIVLLCLWVSLVWVWSFIAALPFGLLVCGLIRGRWRSLKHNFALVYEYSDWPCWNWGDLCRSVIGSMHRQGFFEFTIGKPFWGIGSLMLQPIFKYALQSNVLLDELENKFANQWINPPRPGVSFAYLHEFTKRFVCTALHAEEERSFIDHETTFAAHYPYPRSEDSQTVTGMQFTEADKAIYVTKVAHDCDVEQLRRQGSRLREDGVESCVFHVQILYTNPFHPLVGDVFVNVTSDSRVEHQMHCLASKHTYLGNRAYYLAHRLFGTTFLRAAMKYFDEFGLRRNGRRSSQSETAG
jgi:hypothetical protein